MAASQTEPEQDSDIFLWDRVTAGVTLVSHASGSPAQTANDSSYNPKISADGRFVVFTSAATYLVAGSPGGAGPGSNVYLWDRQTGTTILVSHLPGNPSQVANGWAASQCDLSSDGRFVTFASSSTDLTAGLSPDADSNVFLFDRLSGVNVLVSHTAGTASADPVKGSYSPSISADGSFIAFLSSSTQLVGGATYPAAEQQLFLYDRATGLNVLVSHSATAAGTASNNFSTSSQISGDGSWIVFESTATDLVAGQVDPEFSSDVFLYERATGSIQLVNRVAGTTATTVSGASNPSINADGSAVVYSSSGSGLVDGLADGNEAADVFLFDRATGSNRLVSHSAGSPGETADGFSGFPVIAPDGSHVAFLSHATNLAAGVTDEADTLDGFLWERATGSVTLVSHVAGQPLTAAARIDYVLLAISGSGSHLAFLSNAANLTGASDTNGATDVFLFERSSGLNTTVSYSQPLYPVATGGFSYMEKARLDAQGRYAAFNSGVADLVPQQDDKNQVSDVFVADRLTGAIQLVSRSAGSTERTGNGPSNTAEISADGNWIAFSSTATDLVTGQVDVPDSFDVFLFNRADGSMVLVSRTAASPLEAAGRCYGASISADGRFVAFTCSSTGLVPGQVDSNGVEDVFLYDRISGTTTLVSHASGSADQTGSDISISPKISPDGQFIAYASKASDLVSGQIDPVSGYDLFLYDRPGGSSILVTRANGSTVEAVNGHTFTYYLNSNASWIGFSSSAAGLVPGVNEGNPWSSENVFLFERSTGAITLVSRSSTSSSLPGNGNSSGAALSQDGRWIAFQSVATDLVPGQSDTAATVDVFLHDRQEGTTVLVSHTANSWTEAAGAGVGGFESFLLSADGGRVAFRSSGTSLVAGQIDVNGGVDFFLYHRPSRAIELVTHIPSSPIATGAPSDMYARFESLSGDGRVALLGTGGNLFAHVSLIGDLAPLDFYTLPPCRALDTRLAQDGPALSSGVEEVFALSGACGAPATARALAVNVTVVQATGNGYLTFYPGGDPRPVASTITFKPLHARSNNVILSLAANGSGTLAVYPSVGGNGTVHLILDITGYYE